MPGFAKKLWYWQTAAVSKALSYIVNFLSTFVTHYHDPQLQEAENYFQIYNLNWNIYQSIQFNPHFKNWRFWCHDRQPFRANFCAESEIHMKTALISSEKLLIAVWHTLPCFVSAALTTSSVLIVVLSWQTWRRKLMDFPVNNICNTHRTCQGVQISGWPLIVKR